MTAPGSVVFHNGWRWCNGPQAVPPPSPADWPPPPWFLGGGGGGGGGAAAAEGRDEAWVAEHAALDLFESFLNERAAAEEAFEERNRRAGGRLGEAELEEDIAALYGDFRVWPTVRARVGRGGGDVHMGCHPPGGRGGGHEACTLVGIDARGAGHYKSSAPYLCVPLSLCLSPPTLGGGVCQARGRRRDELCRAELVVGVLTREAAEAAAAARLAGQPPELAEVPVYVSRAQSGAVDQFFVKGRPFADLYAALRAIKEVRRLRRRGLHSAGGRAGRDTSRVPCFAQQAVLCDCGAVFWFLQLTLRF